MINTNLPKERLYWLDLFRFIAAFMVLLSHSRGDFFGDYGSLPVNQQGLFTMMFFSFSRLGHEAVLIFFVLSGYLVGGRAIERIKNGTFDVRSYSIDRCVRIFLPLISAILLYICVCAILGSPINWITCIGNLFSFQGIFVESLVGPFWSLSYEVWFYIIMGSMAMMLSSVQKKNRKNKIISFVVFAICILVFTQLKPIYLFIWIMGAFAYTINPKKNSIFICWSSLLLMFVSLAILQMTTKSVSVKTSLYLIFRRDVIEVIFSLFCCFFVQQIVLMKPVHKWSIALDNIGIKLAVFSYTLYLVHRIIFLILFKYFFTKSCQLFTIESILLYFLFLFIVLIISYTIYFFFERNTSIVKKYIKTNIIIK